MRVKFPVVKTEDIMDVKNKLSIWIVHLDTFCFDVIDIICPREKKSAFDFNDNCFFHMRRH
jgi:hypothetical protein